MQPTYTLDVPFDDYPLYKGLFKAVPLTRRHPHARERARSVILVSTYAIANTRTGMAYVGSTEETLRRWKTHHTALRGGYHTNTQLQEAYDVDGEHFRFVILRTYESTAGLIEREVADGLAFTRTEDLYNYRLGSGFINGWGPTNSTGGKVGYKAKRTYGPHCVGRWFDFTGAKHA